MKIKNFMKETDKKLKKHSYNAHTIMEELQGNVKLIDVIKNPKLNPDVIYNDDVNSSNKRIGLSFKIDAAINNLWI